MSDNGSVARGTSPPPSGLADTDVADWRTVAEAASVIGCSKRTVERLAAAKKLESRIRPQAGSPGVAVYNPDDVHRIAAARRPGAVPFVLDAGVTPHANGNGRHTAEVTKTSHLNNRAEDPFRQLAALVLHALQSPPSPPVAERVAESTLFLTLPEAAALSGLSPTYLRKKISDKTLSAIRDRGWKIRRKDLEAL